MPDNSTAYLLHRLVFQLDRAADHLLQAQVGISYKRALFLLILQQSGTVTQHALAVALGYSDPAVSMMLLELAKAGYVTITTSQTHARKRLVSITPKGSAVVAQGTALLDAHFNQLLDAAGVEAEQYQALTQQLYDALTKKMKEGFG